MLEALGVLRAISTIVAELGLGSQRPDLIVRFGHGPAMPRSLRRPLSAVITPP